MEDFEEVIVLLKIGRDFIAPTEELSVNIPGLTADLKRLELKELKIGINSADVGADVSWITLDIKGPGGGLLPTSGSALHTVPALEGGGTVLYRQYHHDNLVLLKLNALNATTSGKPIKIRILKADGTRLAVDYVYLRMGLFEAHNYTPYMQPLDVHRFQAF